MIQEILKEYDEEWGVFKKEYDDMRAFLEKSLKRVEGEAYERGKSMLDNRCIGGIEEGKRRCPAVINNYCEKCDPAKT